MIACVILNFNGRDMLRRCLASLPDCVAIVVDNGSTDQSQRMVEKEFQAVKLIRRAENIGTAGYNDGIRYALDQGCSYIFLGSSDLEFADREIFNRLVSEFESRDQIKIGILAPDQVMPDGTVRSTGGKVSPLRLTIRSAKTDELDYAWNCMVKREVFEKVGFIEPSYFMYWEDVDFGARARNAGFKVMASHKTWLYHIGSASADKVHGLKGYLRLRNKLLYSKRNHDAARRIYDSLTVTLEVPAQLLLRRKYGDETLVLLGYLHGMAIMLGLKKASSKPWGPVGKDGLRMVEARM